MGLCQDLAEVLDPHSRVDLGALEALVAEELLDVADIFYLAEVSPGRPVASAKTETVTVHAT